MQRHEINCASTIACCPPFFKPREATRGDGRGAKQKFSAEGGDEIVHVGLDGVWSIDGGAADGGGLVGFVEAHDCFGVVGGHGGYDIRTEGWGVIKAPEHGYEFVVRRETGACAVGIRIPVVGPGDRGSGCGEGCKERWVIVHETTAADITSSRIDHGRGGRRMGSRDGSRVGNCGSG